VPTTFKRSWTNYTLCTASPQKITELEELSRGLGKEILKIGKFLDTRWVASSFRTVSALWNDFEALCHHFEAGRSDGTRSKCEQSKFHGLLK